MSLLNKTEWDTFLSGYWTKDMPQRSGTFPIATQEGHEAGCVGIYCSSKTGEYVQARNYDWGGWFWSEPLPRQPKPPEW